MIGAFINYNAILKDGGNYSGNYGDDRVANVAFDGGSFRTTCDFDRDGDYIRFNKIRTNMNKSGTFEYVSDSARFQSYLLRDRSDDVIGVVFIQLKSS